MKRRHSTAVETAPFGRWMTAASAAVLVGNGLLATARGDWPEFLGPGGRGVATESVRSRWSEDDGIAWKTDLPGRGASSPIVIGDVVVVTAASGPRQDRLHVVALDADSGQVRWRRTFQATGRTLCHPTSSVAAPTPAAADGRIVALFSSCDLFALDLEGRLLWQRNLALEHPKSGNDVGMGSSPRIIDGTVVVQIDCQGDAFASGIDLATGEDRWSVPRDRIASWASPLPVTLSDGRAGVLLQNPNGLELRDVSDGRLVWSWKGDCSGIPTTAALARRLFAPVSGLVAVDPEEGAAVTGGAVAGDPGPASIRPAWQQPKLSCGMASPVAWGDAVACINRAGVLVIGGAADGGLRGQVRLAGSFWGSPVVAGDTIVAVGKEGRTFLVAASDPPRIVADNELPGTFTASPAVDGGALYLRSETTLWKVAAP
jgi:outer membrane protein assembly factor BamB